MMRKQPESKPEIEIKNDIHIYTHMNIDRKIPHDKLEVPMGGSISYKEMDREMVRRGCRKGEHIKNVESYIIERQNKKYSVENLSLLSLIESVLLELTRRKYPVDPLKIEILLILFKNEEIFHSTKDLFDIFHATPSFDKASLFLSILKYYLVSIAKMLVTEIGHDFLIIKSFKGKLNLIPVSEYDSKFNYFSKMRSIY